MKYFTKASQKLCSDAQFGKANYANTVRWIKMVINAHNEVNFFAESAQSDSSHDQNEPQTPEQPTEFQSAETVRRKKLILLASS